MKKVCKSISKVRVGRIKFISMVDGVIFEDEILLLFMF